MIKRIKQKLGFGLTSLLLLAALYVAFHFLFLDFVVDSWWFKSLGYGTYFWQRALYKYVILGGFSLVFFVIFFCNFWIASRFLKRPQSAAGKSESDHKIASLITNFRRGSMRIYTPLSIVLALILAYPLFRQWETTLLFIFAPKAGLLDPIYGKDVSFFLFTLPVFRMIQMRLFISFAVLFGATFVLYGMEIALLKKQTENFQIPRMVKLHLSALTTVLFLLAIGNFLLERYELVYKAHKAFYGPGFVEMNVTAPLIWLSVFLLLVTLIALLVFVNTGRGWKYTLASAVLFLLVYGIKSTHFLETRVQKYVVKPNEISRESKYIERSIKATLQAYGLTGVKIREYRPSSKALFTLSEELENVVRNVPVWDKEMLHDVYKQLQGIRPYYDFTDVDVDRYTINGLYQQVFVGARELVLSQLPENARNWVNLHMKYTHGHGAVMTPAVQGGEEPITWFLKDIPPKSDYGIRTKRPAIYYGTGKYTYIIAPNDLGEMGYPQGEKVIPENYSGRGGVSVSSLFRKIIFSIYFKDRNIFFTTKTNKESRVLFRRNIIDRIATITPFLILDRDPYVVVTPKGIFWIQDAYTVSKYYPNAKPYGKGGFNYVRNSVKIVVDAYNGTVDYYIWDEKDPIIRAYARAYPGLFKNRDQMDPQLKQHVRYPKDLFEIQMRVFARYHQKNPETFYKQEDAWRFARIFKGDKEQIITPYYLTLNLLNPAEFEFLLVQPFSPRGLDTLRAIATVSCDGSRYGKIVVFAFPKDIQVYGPSQINALIDQDTYVSQQFTLWNQIGSEVERGKMIILPHGGSVLYIQPVYLKASTRLKIPELKRLIVAYEDTVVMDVNLELAISKLSKRLRTREEMFRKRIEKFSGKKTP